GGGWVWAAAGWGGGREGGEVRWGWRSGSSSSSRRTRRARKTWNGAYHSRSQCVWGTIPTVVGRDSVVDASCSGTCSHHLGRHPGLSVGGRAFTRGAHEDYGAVGPGWGEGERG